MKKLYKRLFGCWHDNREVEGNDWYTTYQCRKCQKRFTVDNW